MSGVQMSLLCIPAEHCDWGQDRGFFVGPALGWPQRLIQ